MLVVVVLLEVAPHRAQRQEADDDEGGADEEIERRGRDDERGERRGVLVADVAQPGEFVSVDAAQRQHRDGLDGRDGPRGDVEVAGARVDSLATPAPC